MALHLGLGIPEPRYTLLTTYETTEPPIERRYLLCGGTLQNVGSHPLRDDIRFTERTMTEHFCMRDAESLMFVTLGIQNR